MRLHRVVRGGDQNTRHAEQQEDGLSALHSPPAPLLLLIRRLSLPKNETFLLIRVFCLVSIRTNPNTFCEDTFAQPNVDFLFNWTWFQAIPALIVYALFLRNGLRVVDEELTAEKSTRIRWYMTRVVCFAILHSILDVVLVCHMEAVSVVRGSFL
ncbi:hypothetical protein GCK72_016108 [Caenorhabditis remanei]|uniref:Uncharacterized protein n=1 Tax=Caenorhabditis remanei TaxID=31234 RepID=A0A6A5GY69_CAERE|nr:hypothetical protein GCK72_016108 [Caenorhabditis remanei]KAF1759641.1 hypothetical protein GCK72_016108 [Caenorhabditis remanei]